ncbi:heterokaryon incompatibility protein-domain-containing protein [Apiospora phragmitis]|uniref:Heterokaryon incompatibility protein-domain-containing protein n=1 Tax=Apiospora phragmitis TaxID=2905665 RepID=A0ABR1T2Q4_9PEZI
MACNGILGDQPYHYRPLEAGHIRLLGVYPERKHQVKCEIIHVSLDQLHPYTAISYAWGGGGTGLKESIRLYHEESQCDLPVASSLYGALAALHDKQKSIWVWVDALCIDQQNRDERSQQVRLMTSIYSLASSVATWLGPEADGSNDAVRFLQDMADKADSPREVSMLIRSGHKSGSLAAVVSLFARNYWQRFWIMQEVLNAPDDPIVYCGSTKVSWKVYRKASDVFLAHRAEINEVTERKMDEWSRVPYQFSTSQATNLTNPSAMRLCFMFFAFIDESSPRIRETSSMASWAFSPESISQEFQPNYDKSVKFVYSDIVDTLINMTGRLDVICDAIHFPLYTGAHSLPSFVPDWSHILQTSAMGHRFRFSASKKRRADTRFTDPHLNKLQFKGIYLEMVERQGVAVGTHCRSSDWLMAFLHWRALVLQYVERIAPDVAVSIQDEFAETLCLGQTPGSWTSRPRQWLEVCYHVLATLLRARLPHLALDAELRRHAEDDDVAMRVDLGPGESPRQFLQTHFGNRMMGRCFFLTRRGRLGMGTGYMAPGDIIVVPPGCSTPVLLRAEGPRGEYRFVGTCIFTVIWMVGRSTCWMRES